MTTLAELMEEAYMKVPSNASKSNSTGFMYVTLFKSDKYSKGYTWRYQKRADGNRFTCSSSSLIGLREKCFDNGYPWVIVNIDKAKESCELENIDWDIFLNVGEVIYI